MNEAEITIDITPKKWLVITLALTVLSLLCLRLPSGYGYEFITLLLFAFTLISWLGCLAILIQKLTSKPKPTHANKPNNPLTPKPNHPFFKQKPSLNHNKTPTQLLKFHEKNKWDCILPFKPLIIIVDNYRKRFIHAWE